jgi:hypothetical protein
MSEAAVRDILEKIEQLSDDDRLSLSMTLAERADAEWRTEVDGARRIAREKGITETAIGQALNEIRRGTRKSFSLATFM